MTVSSFLSPMVHCPPLAAFKMSDYNLEERVDLGTLARKAAEVSFADLQAVAAHCVDLEDAPRKMAMLKWMLHTKQKLLRLLAVTKWAMQVPCFTPLVCVNNKQFS